MSIENIGHANNKDSKSNYSEKKFQTHLNYLKDLGK